MSTTVLTQPGEVFANIPGVLGFYPEDSIVLITFDPSTSSDHWVHGVTARVDIDAVHELFGATDFIGEDTPVFALIVSDDPVKISHGIAGVAALDGEDALGMLLGCWWTRRVFTGEPFQRVTGLGHYADAAADECDEGGSISPVRTARATIDSPHPPAATRDAAFAQFEHDTTVLGAETAADLTRQAQRRASELDDSASHAGFSVEFSDFLADLNPARDTTDTLMRDQVAMLMGLTAVGDLRVRDFTMADLLDAPLAGMGLMQAVARTTTDSEVRCHALCMYALAAWKSGADVQGDRALEVSFGEAHRHTLTNMLRSLRQRANGRALGVSLAYQGSLLTRGED